MLLSRKDVFIPFSPSTAFSIVSGLRARREKVLLESPNRRKTIRASSTGPKAKVSKKPKFDSPLLEQLFSGLSKELQEVVLGKKSKK